MLDSFTPRYRYSAPAIFLMDQLKMQRELAGAAAAQISAPAGASLSVLRAKVVGRLAKRGDGDSEAAVKDVAFINSLPVTGSPAYYKYVGHMAYYW